MNVPLASWVTILGVFGVSLATYILYGRKITPRPKNTLLVIIVHFFLMYLFLWIFSFLIAVIAMLFNLPFIPDLFVKWWFTVLGAPWFSLYSLLFL